MATFTNVVIFTVAVLVAASSAIPKPNTSLKIPEECKGKGFCYIKPEGYDELVEMVNNLLKPYLVEKKHITDRIGGKPGQTELSPESDWHNCPYIKTAESIAYTYQLENQTEFDFIVQSSLLNQPIENIKCAHEKVPSGSAQCFQDLTLNTLGMESSCQTTYTTRKLLTYDMDIKKFVLKEYPVPCCCTCKINNSI